MDATMDAWIDQLTAQLREAADAFWGEVRQNGLMPLLEPIAPYNRPSFLAPAVAIGGVLGMLLLSGVALTAAGGLVLSLLGIYVLLVEVFGVSVELQPIGPRR